MITERPLLRASTPSCRNGNRKGVECGAQAMGEFEVDITGKLEGSGRERCGTPEANQVLVKHYIDVSWVLREVDCAYWTT